MLRIESIAICFRRCARVGIRKLPSGSRTNARFLIMHANEPGIPTGAASISLASISQRTKPGHHCDTSAVGQMRALIVSKNVQLLTQNTRLAAATFRRFICQKNGGISRINVMHARTGTAIAPGDT